jgi:mono/diheme cytochrome c family protein
MKKKPILWVAAIFIFLAAAIGSLMYVRQHGFSARAQPSSLEAMIARNVRRLAIPANEKDLKSPITMTDNLMNEAREHFMAHCSSCHGFNGRGETTIGRNLYPKVPNMTEATTQKLTDGELYYIISNGIRFTGMPAWGNEDSPESIWALVAFIRKLPQLSPEEVKQLQEMAEGSSEPGASAPSKSTESANDVTTLPAAAKTPAQNKAVKPKLKKPPAHSHALGSKPHDH